MRKRNDGTLVNRRNELIECVTILLIVALIIKEPITTYTSYSFTPFCNSTSVLFLNFATSLMDRDNRTDNREDGVMYADEFLNVGFCVGTVVEPYTGCVPTLSCKQQPCNPKTIAKKSHFQSEES